jgi:hypothetical protein
VGLRPGWRWVELCWGDDRKGSNDEEKGDDERIFGLLDCGPFLLRVYFYHLALI